MKKLIMTLQTIHDYINAHTFPASIDEIWDNVEEGFEDIKNVEVKFIKTIDTDEHRWFTIEWNVYQFSYKGKVLGNLAITEVGTIKSEYMGISDCGIDLCAQYVKEVVTTTFEPVEEPKETKVSLEEEFLKLLKKHGYTKIKGLPADYSFLNKSDSVDAASLFDYGNGRRCWERGQVPSISQKAYEFFKMFFDNGYKYIAKDQSIFAPCNLRAFEEKPAKTRLAYMDVKSSRRPFIISLNLNDNLPVESCYLIEDLIKEYERHEEVER